MSRMILTVKPAPKITTIVRGIGQPGPEGPAGADGLGFSTIASGTILGNGLGSASLPQALNAVTIRTILGLATFDSPTFAGLTINGALTASGTVATTGNVRGASIWFGGASTNNTKFYSTSSGLLQIYNAAETAGVMVNVTGNSAVFRNLANNADAPISCSNLTASGTIASGQLLLTSDVNGAVIRPAGAGAGNLTITDPFGGVALYKSSSGTTHIGGVAANGGLQVTTGGNVTVPGTGTHTFGTTNTVTMANGLLTATASSVAGASITVAAIGSSNTFSLHANAGAGLPGIKTPAFGDFDMRYCTNVRFTNINAEGTITYSSINFPELVTNGDFSVGTGWTLGTGWTISGGTAVATSVASFADIQQNIPAVNAGQTYVITFTVSITSGTIAAYLGTNGNGNSIISIISASGSYSFLFHKNPLDTTKTILFRGNPTFTGTVDNVSVKRAF